MKISISREAILNPLQMVNSVIERRQTLPILSNVLLSVKDNTLSLTGTDLEVEIINHCHIDNEMKAILHCLPESSLIYVKLYQKVQIWKLILIRIVLL